VERSADGDLPKEIYHVARPHGILAETSMNATVHISPLRLSTWDGGQCKDTSRPPLHADEWPMVASQSIARDLLRLVPDAGKLRRSIVIPK
jgi:hypothetical protein